MGEVYLGRDEQARKPVAIKALRVELQEKSGEIFQRRFQEEVEILQRLHAPGVPAFVDAFQEGQRSFLIMEYIEGHSLEQLLTRSKANSGCGLRPRLVNEVGIQVCRTLEHLHNQQPPLIHRDIKPSNVIIRSSDEQVFLVDFGLAREVHSQAGGHTLVGTVGYCPLEQFQGQPEPRSDLYALGATMFELLTACVPQALNIPPLENVLPDLPRGFCEAINRSVRNTPEERFPDAGEMASALAGVHDDLRQWTPSQDALPPLDQVEELIQNWGRTASSARQATNRGPSRKFFWLRSLGLLALLVLAYWGWSYQGRQRYDLAQKEFVEDGLLGGAPGQDWRLSQATGLFPAEGLGLGEPDRDWDSSVRSGLIYDSEQSQNLRVMKFQVRRLKGHPRLLAYCQPWGVLLEPQGDDYELRVLRIEQPLSLDATRWKEVATSPRVTLADFRKVDVRLSASEGQAQLVVDRQEPIKFELPGEWRSQQCGLILLNPLKKARCVVADWQIQ